MIALIFRRPSRGASGIPHMIVPGDGMHVQQAGICRRDGLIPCGHGAALPRRRIVNRRNLALRTSESWRPPALRNPTLLRRLGDLQLQSIWRDLRPLLAQERGDVLDVGCGEQPYRSLLTSAGSYQGLDIADANDRFGYGRDDTLYVNGYPWPVPGESID